MRQLKIQSQITSRDSLSLEKYLQDINKVDLITPEQEVQLAARIRQGDQQALHLLTKANLRFVVSVAKQYQNQGLLLSDLINEGNLGLIKAGQRFDETKGFKFISYAVWWIRQAIMQALVEQARMVRLPLNKVESYQKMNKVLAKFLQEYQREPNMVELSELTNMSPKDVNELLCLGGKHVSIDAPRDDDGDDGLALIDTMSSNDTTTPDSKLMSESLTSEVNEILSVLPVREIDILVNYFGLNGTPAISLEDIAEKFDLTRERVRQIKERAIRRLRKGTNNKELKNYM